MDAALKNIDVVYDLAKALGEKWEDYFKHDVLVTKNIAERALAKGVRRFIYTGTIASYYSAKAGDVITSDTPLDPKINRRNHYARSKAMCEALLMDMYHKHRFPVVIMRPRIVVGKDFHRLTGEWGCFLLIRRYGFGEEGNTNFHLSWWRM